MNPVKPPRASGYSGVLSKKVFVSTTGAEEEAGEGEDEEEDEGDDGKEEDGELGLHCQKKGSWRVHWVSAGQHPTALYATMLASVYLG